MRAALRVAVAGVLAVSSVSAIGAAGAAAVPSTAGPLGAAAAGILSEDDLIAAAAAADVRIDPREFDSAPRSAGGKPEQEPDDGAPDDGAPDDGNGGGNGSGNGDGNGGGNGSGNGDGNGDGNGSGNGDGNGSGSGNGDGNGDGNGSGNGCGWNGNGDPASDLDTDTPAPAPAPTPAKVPLPPGPATPPGLPAEVDPLASYQGQFLCSPDPKPGALKITELLQQTYSTTDAIWIPRDCSVGGRSEHKEGRAVDWMIDQSVPGENAQAESFLQWLLATDENGEPFAMARRLGIMYIGWGDEIWESYTQQWTELKGCYSKPDDGYDTYCHRDHIHLSLSWDGAAAQTSFWGGDPTPAPTCQTDKEAAAEAMPVGNGLDYLPVTPRRLLDTRSGLGLERQPCRLTQLSSGGPGAPVVINVAALADSPGEGMRAVAVRLVSSGSNSPASLRAITGGDATMLDIAMNGRREMTTILPVAKDGTLAFTTDSGAGHLAVDLLGYFVKPATATDAGGGRLLTQSGLVAYDSRKGQQPLGPGEKRLIDVGLAATTEGPPAGALVSVTAVRGEGAGSLVVRRTGERRTAATQSLAYRKDERSTTNVLTALDPEGRITVVNAGAKPVDVVITLQASAVRTQSLGYLLVPVAPKPVEPRRTTLTRLLRKPTGAKAAILQVSLRSTGEGGSVTFWSLLEPEAPSLSVARGGATSALVIVPLSREGTIARSVDGDGLQVDAAVVAYLR